jgi:hypothetical protein
MVKTILLSVFFLLFNFATQAQVTTYSLDRNARLQEFHLKNPNYVFQASSKNKLGTRDTLDIPFFDDFSQSTLFPDSILWLNNQVHINNQFPILPPTLNVATFDVLDPQGIPYRNTLNRNFKDAGDSLISQPINLSSNGDRAYSVADSIILSFYYQPNGYGYHLNGEDILRLWFKAKNGLWFQVWSKVGESKSRDFEQVMIPLLDSNFFHAGFQFMFTTFTRQVGNANHWHIDYVLLDKDRDRAETTYNDYAIQTTPTSLLKDYWAMPYEHFSQDPDAFMDDSVRLSVSNLAGIDKRLEIRHEAYANGTMVTTTAFPTNVNNHDAQSTRQRNLPIYSIANVPNTGEVNVQRIVAVREAGVPNDVTVNDQFSFTQIFHDYYAYDDGTAEQNFGFDEESSTKNTIGEVAYGFNVAKRDTLYAIATYFNQAVYDGSRNRFKYRIWKELKGVNRGLGDSIIYESEEMTPTYSIANGQRTFTPFNLDTVLVLDPGRYYIGWWQGSIFNLNIGWDMNYGNTQNMQRKNPNLLAKTSEILDEWSNDVPEGTLMMRPHFGSKRPLYAGVHSFEKKRFKPTIYPNPTRSDVYFEQEYEQISIVNSQGQEVLLASNVSKLSVSNLPSGLYFVVLRSRNGEQSTARLVIITH